MPLQIAIGFDGSGNNANPYPVYVGKSGAELQAALDRSPAARFEIFKCAIGLRKNNAKAAANADRLTNEILAGAKETDNLADQLSQAIALIAELKEAHGTALQAAATEIATLKQNLELAERSLRVTEDSVVRMGTLANTLGTENASQREQIAAREAKLSAANDLIANLEVELTAAKAQIPPPAAPAEPTAPEAAPAAPVEEPVATAKPKKK